MQAEGENRTGSAQEEMEILRKRIAELEAEDAGREKHEIIQEAIKEHAEKKPEEILHPEKTISSQEAGEHAKRIKNIQSEDAHRDKIIALMQMVHDKGILNTVSIIKNINDPHLEDDFHQALVKYFKNSENV
ncbi:hypothetical protein KKD04_00305 [Patescibacteria group bacterium]|nr:hypothetical protein [Patescibacteria group bacterium]